MRSLGDADAVLFDLDGVLTDTASLHRQAWAETFRQVFEVLGAGPGGPVRAFTDEDYRRLVDGRLRVEGVRNVLADRGLLLPDGRADDPPGCGSVAAIAGAKDARFLELLETDGPRPFPGSVALLRRLRSAGTPVAVVTASRHCSKILEAAGLAGLVDATVDGQVAASEHLAGKPAPDTFVAAARRLGTPPERCAVLEDATAGVAAGRAGRFGLVVGVDRGGAAAGLAAAGADLVVSDLADLLTGW